MPVIGALAAAVAVATAPWPGDWRPSAAQARQLARGGLVVEMLPDPGRSSGVIHAAVDVRAPARRVWALLTDCAEAPRLVKFIKACRLLDGPGPAGGWDLREDQIQPAFILPPIRTVFRSEFETERRIVFHCTSASELKVCDGAWRLEPTPDGAVRVTYASQVASPYPLPDFIIRTVLASEMAELDAHAAAPRRRAVSPGLSRRTPMLRLRRGNLCSRRKDDGHVRFAARRAVIMQVAILPEFSMPRTLLAPLVVLVLALSGGAAAAQTAVPPIDFHERVLPNGLKVITSLDRTTPNVTVQVWYGVGAKNDPPGRSGFAHLFEHMMFKATRDMPAEYMDRLTEDVGGMNNAFTQDDTTAFYEVIPAADLQRLLWAEADRMSTLVVDKANFNSERQVVEEELRQRVLASPYGRLFYYDLPEDSFAVHPYHRSAIGSIENLDAATLDDLQNFHATFYRPDNATLVVAGNFDPDQLNAWIDKYFGPLKNPPTPIPQVTAVEPPRTGPREVTNYGADVPLPAVAITWLAPKASDPDAPALQVLDALLTAGKSSRLYDSLVYEKQIAAQVFSSADLRQQLGMFYVGAIVAQGHTPDEVAAALRAQVAALRDQPVEPRRARHRQDPAADQRDPPARDHRGPRQRAGRRAGDRRRRRARQHRHRRARRGDGRRCAARGAQVPARRPAGLDQATCPRAPKPPGAAAEAAPPPPVASKPYTGPVAALLPEGQRQAPPPIGSQPPAVLPTPVERTLPNGLRVIVAHERPTCRWSPPA